MKSMIWAVADLWFGAVAGITHAGGGGDYARGRWRTCGRSGRRIRVDAGGGGGDGRGEQFGRGDGGVIVK